MRIPDETLEEIRSRVSIVDLVGRHVALRQTGKNWKGLCPFHVEKTPSFVVSEERGTYHCFGCGAGGSAFRFLMEAEGRTFLEAVRSLAEVAGVALPDARVDPARDREQRDRDRVLEVLDLAARYYRHQLVSGRAGEAARTYLESREVSSEIAETFGLGCAPAGWDALVRFLRGRGVDLAVAATAGLVAVRSSGGYYDRLRDRLVFPIHDRNGRVVSFGGRVLGAGEPKYLNGPETPVFRKRELLYGLHQATEGLRRQRRALLVEGYLDVISLHARGVPTALATLGTSLTADHLQLLRRRVDEVVLVYDGDEAGRKAAFRGLDLFLGEGVACRGVLLPPEHDPDSFVRAGFDLEAIVEDAPSLMDAYLEDVGSRADLSTVEGRLAAVDEVLPRLRAVPDDLARDLYLVRAADRLGVSEAGLRGRLAGGPRCGSRRNEAPAGPGPEPVEPVDPVERAVVACLVQDPSLRAGFVKDGVERWFGSAVARDAARFVANHPEPPGGLPLDRLGEAARGLVSELAVSDDPPPGSYGVLVSRLERRDVEAQMGRVGVEIKRAEATGDHTRVGELLRKKTELHEREAQLKRRGA